MSEKNVRRARIDMGKIAYSNERIRSNPVEVEVELRDCGGDEIFNADGTDTNTQTPKYTELSICANIYSIAYGNKGFVAGGQCLDTINKSRKSDDFRRDLWKELYGFWKLYHLNGMHAGTSEQEDAVKRWKEQGNKYDFTKVCEYLKSIELYEVKFYGETTGRKWNGELYRYGHGWVINRLPNSVIDRVTEIIKEENKYA